MKPHVECLGQKIACTFKFLSNTFTSKELRNRMQTINRKQAYTGMNFTQSSQFKPSQRSLILDKDGSGHYMAKIAKFLLYTKQIF